MPGRGLEQPPGRDEPRPVPPAPVRQVDRQVVMAGDDPADDPIALDRHGTQLRLVTQAVGGLLEERAG